MTSNDRPSKAFPTNPGLVKVPTRLVKAPVVKSPYIPSSYKLIKKESIKIYNPNVVSIQKRVISS